MKPLGPYALSTNNNNPIDVTWPSSGQPPIGIELENISGLLLQVSLGGQTTWLEPWTARYTPLNGNETSLEILPNQDITPTGADPLKVIANLYQVGDNPPSSETRQLTGLATVAAVTGVVTVQGGTINVGNTPNVNVAGGNINIANSPNVSAVITGGNVGISGTANVSISGVPTVSVGGGSVSISAGNVSIANTPQVTIGGQEALVSQSVISSAAWGVGHSVSIPFTIPAGTECISVSFGSPSGGPYTNQVAISVQVLEQFNIGNQLGNTATDDDVALLTNSTGAIGYDDTAVVDVLSGGGAATLSLADINSQSPATVVTIVAYPYPSNMVRGRKRLSRNVDLTLYPEYVAPAKSATFPVSAVGTFPTGRGRLAGGIVTLALSSTGSHAFVAAPAAGLVRIIDYLFFSGGTSILAGINGSSNLIPITISSALVHPGWVLASGAGGLTFSNSATGGNAYCVFHDETA